MLAEQAVEKPLVGRVASATAPDARRRDAGDVSAHRLGAATQQAGPCRGNPSGARDWGPPALLRLLERATTLSSSPRLASRGLAREGLFARCPLGRDESAKARRYRAGSTGRSADKGDARPRSNPEGRRGLGAPLCSVSSPMPPASVSSPRLAAHPRALASRQRSFLGPDPDPQASCARPARFSQQPVKGRREEVINAWLS